MFKGFKIILTKRNFSDDTYTFSAFVFFFFVQQSCKICSSTLWVSAHFPMRYLENSLSSRQRSVRSRVDLRHVRRRDSAKVSVPVVDSRFACIDRYTRIVHTTNSNNRSLFFPGVKLAQTWFEHPARKPAHGYSSHIARSGPLPQSMYHFFTGKMIL